MLKNHREYVSEVYVKDNWSTFSLKSWDDVTFWRAYIVISAFLRFIREEGLLPGFIKESYSRITIRSTFSIPTHLTAVVVIFGHLLVNAAITWFKKIYSFNGEAWRFQKSSSEPWEPFRLLSEMIFIWRGQWNGLRIIPLSYFLFRSCHGFKK